MDNFGYTCPFCYERDKLAYVYGRESYLSCKVCGARWRLNWVFPQRGEPAILAGAKLIQDGTNGTGAPLLNEEYPTDFWRRMSLEGRKNLPPPPPEMPAAKEKEIITQTRVIVKVKCPYCRNLYDETLDICPHCGGKR